MKHKVHQSYIKSKGWLIATIFVFAVSYIITQILYSYASVKPQFDMKLLTVSYAIPIVLSFLALTFFHFQMLRTGAVFGILVGINLISNVAFTNVILNGTETLMELFEPIFSILPLLGNEPAMYQFDFLKTAITVIQILFGIFMIAINIPVVLKNDRGVFNKI